MEIPADASYEDLAGWLEAVVVLLEQGDLPLEGTLAAYERGIDLVRRCNDLLDGAELRVSELSASLARPAGTGNGTGYSARSLFPDDEETEE